MTGTSNFGLIDVPLPDQSVFLTQILYGSIGWTVGKLVERKHVDSEIR